ncbi:unnamed protein product [Rotaria sp. Silwood1]|nr:unnamed protein product [Rotaria sp. Silwood1]CAF3405555.1 unnamed protein product [Rotaria sp. Silwood1]CAF3421299.1 unnamed protein product [Rotaria sp. Silwood1]CAF3425609.1 unnamed protein product [Rotaria sp. Silwood1]CAF4588667.1 unnamed protein product [Rotaria sp. Silwood1]
MTTVISTSNSEVTTPTSYVSRWIAQSHNAYQNKSNEFYSPSLLSSSSSSSSSCDFRTPTASTKTPSNNVSPTTLKSQTKTTWQAQAKSRSDAAAAAAAATTHDPSFISSMNINNNELQEKLHSVRALLDAKKQRLCRYFSSSSSSTQPDQVLSSTVVGEQSSPPSASSSSILALENVYIPHDESRSSTNYTYHTSSMLPCLMEESPSDSGCSDGAKTVNNDDVVDTTIKNPALVDLSKPLSKEEMLAIIQILRELWRKQFGTEIPDIQIRPTLSTSNSCINRPIGTAGGKSYLSNNKKSQYHSTPTLNKLSAELSDIKDKLKRFSSSRTADEHPKQISTETKSNDNITEAESISIKGDNLIFIPFGTPLTPKDLERMQAKKATLIRRQIQRREEQLIKKNERLTAAIDSQSEYRLYEEYMAQRRQENDLRRKTILQAHIEQKRFEADPPSSNDYYFAAARNRNRLKRKASMQSFVSFDDDISYGGSTFDLFSTTSGKKSIQTPKRTTNRYDYLSPSLTASTTASRSKMNRAASICNINEHYDSFTSLNSKATIPIIRTTRPSALFGGSLMNISMNNNNNNYKQSQQQQQQQQQQRSFNLLDDAFDLTIESPLSGSLSSIALSTPGGSRLARSQTHLSTKSNKKTILNAFKQIVLAGPANERQRDIVTREIELSEARHFIILFRDHRLQFRSVYMYIPETDIIEKLYGVGPNIITEIMVEKWFKYNSGSKRFTNIPIRHFSIQCDAIIIHNDFWQKRLLIHMNKLH